MNRSMNNGWVCGISGVWLAAMVLCLGNLPCVATADEQDAGEEKGEATAPPLAVAPFDAAAAKGHQEAWAKHLGVPVEMTNSIGMKMVLIPAGVFQMGSPESDSSANPDEKPQHTVRITKPFHLGATEVTQEQYERVMGSNPSRFKGPQLPVENVSWVDATDFCRKLSALPVERIAGRVYRLPTEAEWEYACRAGSRTKYSFGDSEDSLGDYAWYYSNSEKGADPFHRRGPTSSQTQPVGQQKANAWALYDMHGSVWEWCSDFWRRDYTSAVVNDPTGPAVGWYRMIRGGSLTLEAWYCRSASRSRFAPDHGAISLGFRPAHSSVDTQSK